MILVGGLFHLQPMAPLVLLPEEGNRETQEAPITEAHEAIGESLDNKPVPSSWTTRDPNSLVSGPYSQTQK